MASYKITFKPSIEKDLRHMPKTSVARIMKHIDDLESNPFPTQCVKLAGTERSYRIRVGDYRVIYEVESDTKQITIHYVRHRRDVYRKL